MIEYEVIRGAPHFELIKIFRDIESQCFNESIHSVESFNYEFETKKNCISILVKEDNRYIAMKIGYERKPEQFYSWLGGVVPGYRGRGIARELMSRQHKILKDDGYTRVKTNTGNEFKSMLVLNLKMGFNIKGIFTNKQGQLRLNLEKDL